MPNARFLFDDKWRTATNLSATSTDTNTALANTQNQYGSRVWRSEDTAAQTITADLTNVEADCLVIAGHNLTGAATVAVTTKLATVTVDTFNVTLNGTTLAVAWFDAAEIDELQIIITDASNPAGYVEFCQLMIGARWSPSENMNLGLRLSAVRDLTRRRTAGQSLRSTGTGIVKRQTSMELEWLTESDRASLKNQIDIADGGPCFISVYPESGNQDETDGQFISLAPDFNAAHWNANYWLHSLEFLEV